MTPPTIINNGDTDMITTRKEEIRCMKKKGERERKRNVEKDHLPSVSCHPFTNPTMNPEMQHAKCAKISKKQQ
jgi:hypothetical protein